MRNLARKVDITEPVSTLEIAARRWGSFEQASQKHVVVAMGAAASVDKKAPSLPFPKKGVKLSVLLKIVEENKGKTFDCPVNHFNLQEERLEKNSKTSRPQTFANLF